MVGGQQTAAGAAPGSGADDSIGIRLVDAPVERRDDPRARSYIVDHLAPGSTIERRIEVTNTTAGAADVALYSAGAELAAEGFTFLNGREGNDLTSWTTVDTPVLPVAAGGVARAGVRIAVPHDAAPGERYGVVWAEVRSAAGDGITTVNRVGIRMYVSVGPGDGPQADFVISGLQPARSSSGAPELVATVENTGARALDVTGELTLDDGPGGVSVGSISPQAAATIPIGHRAAVVFPLDPALPDGTWEATVTLRSGQLERSADARVTFPSAQSAPTAKLGTSNDLSIWNAVAAILVLTVTALFVRRRTLGAAAGPGTTASGA